LFCSPQAAAAVTEIEDTPAPSSDHNEDSNEQRQGSPSSYAEQSPVAALNLCRDATKGITSLINHCSKVIILTFIS